MKKILLICVLAISGSLLAQKNISDMVRLFGENSLGDIITGDGQTKYDMDYYLKGGIVHKKTNGEVKSIALSDIDFTKEFIYQNGLEVLLFTGKNVWEMSLTSKKPKKIAGLSLSFESEEDAVLAFRYLKMRGQNPLNEIKLTGAFSEQFAQIICNSGVNFNVLKGEFLSKKDTMTRVSKVQLEGGLLTKIANDNIEVDFGDFDNHAASLAAYEKIIEFMTKSELSCCKLIRTTLPSNHEENKGAMDIWTLSIPKGSTQQLFTISLYLNQHAIRMTIYSPSAYDDEDDW